MTEGQGANGNSEKCAVVVADGRFVVNIAAHVLASLSVSRNDLLNAMYGQIASILAAKIHGSANLLSKTLQIEFNKGLPSKPGRICPRDGCRPSKLSLVQLSVIHIAAISIA
jgi:hypothetical protein